MVVVDDSAILSLFVLASVALCDILCHFYFWIKFSESPNTNFVMNKTPPYSSIDFLDSLTHNSVI